MSVPSDARSQLMAEIRQGKLGNKRFHSENSLQQFGEEDPVTPEKTDTDPGVSVLYEYFVFFRNTNHYFCGLALHYHYFFTCMYLKCELVQHSYNFNEISLLFLRK